MKKGKYYNIIIPVYKHTEIYIICINTKQTLEIINDIYFPSIKEKKI